ncbi:hypothetical protein FHU29_004613 [Hoyosella altamirensis]|uniref:DUF91 domain-containing protein n=1 Tax=Hoyosella altamirensis TaxID=616997 RepID=A0A839RV63_9ACTN|nr:hypothetical protein [Hoyosella altamirensis]
MSACVGHREPLRELEVEVGWGGELSAWQKRGPQIAIGAFDDPLGFGIVGRCLHHPGSPECHRTRRHRRRAVLVVRFRLRCPTTVSAEPLRTIRRAAATCQFGDLAKERLDVFGLDSSGKTVVVELKRESDPRIHLQAITYGDTFEVPRAVTDRHGARGTRSRNAGNVPCAVLGLVSWSHRT